MKKFLHCLFALLLIECTVSARGHHDFGKIFMFTWPAAFHIATQQALWHNFIYDKHGKVGATIQATTVYQQSRPGGAATRYFLPFGDNIVTVFGDDYIQEKCTRDIRAEWLGLASDFKGEFTVNPQQRQTGLILEAHQDLARFIKSDFLEGVWIDFEFPFIQVENDINVCQFNVFPPAAHCPPPTNCLGGDYKPEDIVQAMNQPAWHFAKMGPKETRFGLGEIKFRFGRAYSNENKDQLIYYAGATIPTAKKNSPEHIFSPFVSNNGHFGFLGGINVQFAINRNLDRYAFCFFGNLETALLLRNHQMRTFDLKGKPWSRYLHYVKKNGVPGETIPGVNLLTFHATVWPYNLVDATVGLRVQGGCIEIEAAYDIWGHAKERVHLHPFDTPQQLYRNSENDDFQARFVCDFGISGTGIISEPGMPDKPRTASRSNISIQAPDDPVFVPVEPRDIDLDSGVAQAAITQALHLSAGLQRHGRGIEWLFNVGMFTAYPHRNGDLNRWGVWGKIGASF